MAEYQACYTNSAAYYTTAMIQKAKCYLHCIQYFRWI